MTRHQNASIYAGENNYLFLGILFLAILFGWCALGRSEEISDAQKKIKPDASSFIEIKNKSPEQMFADANYLYQLGEYESALILFNKVSSTTSDRELKRKSNMAREVIDILMKAERIGGKEGVKETKRADKIKNRQKQEQIAYLYKEAYSRFFSKEYEQSSEIFKNILSIDPQQKEAKYYFQERIPQLVKEEKVRGLYKEALQYFGMQDYPSATKLFNEILAMAPDQKDIRSDIEEKVAFIVSKEKAKDLFEQAKTAYQNSDFEAAKKLFLEAAQIDPGLTKAGEYLDILIPQKEKEQRIAALYKEALTAFNNQEYDQAKQRFYDILALDQNQKEAREYLEAKIPGLIKEQKIKSMLAEGADDFNRKDLALAKEAFARVLELDPANQQATEYLKVKIPEEEKQAKIKELYREATELFALNDYERANGLFKEIMILDKGESEAMDYVQVRIPEKLKAMKVNVLYSEALGCFNNRDYACAYAKFNEILKISPEENEARKFVEDKIPSEVKKIKIAKLYAGAMAAFEASDYPSAKELFKAVLEEDPDQAKAKEYLEKEIPNKLELLRQEQEKVRLVQLEKERKAELERKAKAEKDRQIAQARLEKERKAAQEKLEKERQIVQAKQAERLKQEQIEKAKQAMKDAEGQKKKEVLSTKKEKPLPQEATTTRSQIKEPTAKYSLTKKKPDYPKDGVMGYLYEQAFLAYDSGDYETARDYFTKIMMADPNQSVARDYLAKILKGNG
jgi:cytochrome c-type biogenesis protein CcmH/NrfG